MFVYLVINDVPQELGEIEIVGVFSNKKAAACEIKCLRQIDQYTKVVREVLRDNSIHEPVRKRK